MAELSQNFQNTSDMILSELAGTFQAVILSKLLVFLHKQRKVQYRYQVWLWSCREGLSCRQWPRVAPRCNLFRFLRSFQCSLLLWWCPCPRIRSSLYLGWITNGDRNIFEFLILSLRRRFDDDHLRKYDILSNANLSQVTSQDDTLLEDRMITYLNIIWTFDQTLLAYQVLWSCLVELLLFVAHLLLEEIYHSFWFLFANAYLAHWTICNWTHLCYYKLSKSTTRWPLVMRCIFYDFSDDTKTIRLFLNFKACLDWTSKLRFPTPRSMISKAHR